MTADTNKTMAKIEVALNRLRSQKSAMEYKMKKHKNSQRKARTRTLIQLGGLLEITPLLSICGIEPGHDLQREYFDNAATLLGIIVNSVNQLSENLCEDDLSKFKNLGAKFLKHHVGNAKNIVHN